MPREAAVNTNHPPIMNVSDGHTLDEELRTVLVEELVSKGGNGIQSHDEGFGAGERNGGRRPTHRV